MMRLFFLPQADALYEDADFFFTPWHILHVVVEVEAIVFISEESKL